MEPLKSLEREHPIIDSGFQQFCASHNIFSVEEFLIHVVSKLERSVEKHPNSQQLKLGISVVLAIIDGQHRPWFNGLELLEEAQRNNNVLAIGSERVIRPSSSGKTQLRTHYRICLQAAANIAKSLGNVIFLDTGNSFSPKRIAPFVCQDSDPAGIEIGYRVQMLIVDSVSSLISPIHGSDAHGHALMVSVGFLLKEIAHEHNLYVLVTNHMVSGEGGHLKPELG